MIILDGKTDLPEGIQTKIAIGKFDGVHLGHRKLLSSMTEEKDGLLSLVFTFAFASTVTFTRAHIDAPEEKRRIFENLGIDYLVEYFLDKESAGVSPETFVREILVGRLHMKKLYCGPDLSFGKGGAGNIETLRKLSGELGIEVVVIEKEQFEGEDISSTRIRESLEQEDFGAAEAMLGRSIMQTDRR